ncbi:MAG: CDP-glycerol glycerophosphotransferase family protein [Marmoricola sp.]
MTSQTYRDSAVHVVGWGPGEEHRDLATARNHALATVRARYARLVEAGDLLPWHSTALLVRALRSSPAGSAAGRSQRAGGWRDQAFTPAPGVEPGGGDRLLDLAAWRSTGAAFAPEHGSWGDATLAGLDAEAGCTTLDAVVHEDLGRTAALPFGHLRRWAAEVDAWAAAVSAVAAPGAGWACAVLDTRLPAVLSDVESLTAAQWEALVAIARRLWPLADPERVRATSRVLTRLVADDRREEATRLVIDRWRGPDDIATTVGGGAVHADLGLPALPEEATVLGRAETPLVLSLQARSATELEVVGFVREVETLEPPTVVATSGGRRLRCTGSSTPRATLVAGEAEHCHDHAWLRIERPSTGRVEVTLTSQGVTRGGVLDVPPGQAPLAPHTDPRPDDEIGPYAQARLQRWYAGPHPVEPDLVYFQAYTGQSATDSPLAVHEALRRVRPDLRTRWLVDRPGVPLPPGAEPVLLRSREWYATLARARWLVTNIEMDGWFRRKPGQDLVQTFHGNPGKTMGLAAWERAGYTPRRIERLLDHGPRNWTLLVSPSPEMTRHYREQFRYDGPVMEHGYPRDDVLVGPDAAAVRERTRRALGIGADRTAVLYAPTWRDEQATDHRAARLHEGFDVAAAAAALGEGHVLLLRGHRFHRDQVRPGGARVLDVTAHPDVNDLILAADAAVLDYSSLRFDFALTTRPMVFCVPDLEQYAEGRGFLYDYAESAPGPLLRTTEEVVEALRDLDGLAASYGPAIAAFNARFNAYQDGHAADRVVAAMLGSAAG